MSPKNRRVVTHTQPNEEHTTAERHEPPEPEDEIVAGMRRGQERKHDEEQPTRDADHRVRVREPYDPPRMIQQSRVPVDHLPRRVDLILAEHHSGAPSKTCHVRRW